MEYSTECRYDRYYFTYIYIVIHSKEINKVATVNRLKDTQIEKDYVLSWLLFGISKNEILSGNLVFKGGTVLKKAYFPDYRFSEDIDFTLLDNRITNDQLLEEFTKVYELLKKDANIGISFKESNTHISGSIGFYLNYVGPLQGNLGSRDVKLDITRGEILEFAEQDQSIFKLYSDMPDEFSLKCYSLPEVLIEKMAALMARTEPRDLYDFWYLNEIGGIHTKDYVAEFERKAANKGQDPKNFEKKVLEKEKTLEQGWKKKLEGQIYDLPRFTEVFRQVKRHLKLSNTKQIKMRR